MEAHGGYSFCGLAALVMLGKQHLCDLPALLVSYELVFSSFIYCVKKCMEYEVEGRRPRGRPRSTWREVVEKDCQADKLNKEDAIDCSRWRKLIKDV